MQTPLECDNSYDITVKRLITLRMRKGLSQRALARLSKISQVTIARIETGVYDPRLSTLRKLAKALKVKVRDLVE